MAWKEHEIEKLYWSIGDVAEMIGVEQTATIRFWEQTFNVFPAHRSRKGDRKYTVPEIALLKLIATAVKDLKLTAVKRLLNEGGEERLQEVVDSLKRKQ